MKSVTDSVKQIRLPTELVFYSAKPALLSGSARHLQLLVTKIIIFCNLRLVDTDATKAYNIHINHINHYFAI